MSEQAPSTITAWQFAQKGLLSQNIEKKADVKLPKLKKDQVLVKVHAASLNPVDWKLASLVPGFLRKLPATPGSDFAGEVVQLSEGSDITSRSSWLKPGAKIYGLLPAENNPKTGLGTLATYTIANAATVAPIPASMLYEEAAGLSLVGLTAAALAIHVRRGHSVLLLGGSTAVGLLLIQMVKAEGASKLVATASGEKCQIVKERGADQVIDYRATNVETELKAKYASEPFDLILDCIGSSATFPASPAFLKKGGVYYNIGASSIDPNAILSSGFKLIREGFVHLFLPSFLGGTPRKYVMTGLDQKLMDKLDQYVQKGVVTPKIERTFEFSEAKEAYAHLIKGRSVGKVIVRVDQA